MCVDLRLQLGPPSVEGSSALRPVRCSQNYHDYDNCCQIRSSAASATAATAATSLDSQVSESSSRVLTCADASEAIVVPNSTLLDLLAYQVSPPPPLTTGHNPADTPDSSQSSHSSSLGLMLYE
ncbi:GH13755 [Drosophila grimshawi]|uniref:GH13755 n=1 Tax=Drosophila grimshawi TaxID=7222 RepID=B4JQT7_DROGR|nr:GH13755 [Drosophila grimshawi]